MAFVVVEKGSGRDIGRKFPLDERGALIGRGTTGSKPDIALQDEFISRRHAEISFNNHIFLLRDLNSTNGTILDGQRIESNKPYRLKQDSSIGLGIVPGGEARVVLRFKELPTTETTRLGSAGDITFLDWLRIDLEKGEIFVDDKPVIVSRKEYDLILYLHDKAGKVCSKDEVIANVWPEVVDASGVSDAAIDQLLHRLRLKIERDPTNPKRLISRRGFGYILT